MSSNYGAIFRIPSMSEGYRDICMAVLMDGELVAPRGQRTLEILNAIIILEDPVQSLPYGTGRGLHPAVGAVEALQLMGGFSDPQLMCAVSPHFKPFLEGTGYHGPYGIRLRGQLEKLIKRLSKDPDTRQAVVTIWDPINDLHVDGALDYPCTVMLQFLVRDGRLHMHTTMRSNDVWLGLPYDVFQFTQLQLTIANILDLEAGPYMHHAVSLHAYERDWEKIPNLVSVAPTDRVLPTGLDVMTYGDMVVAARDLATNRHATQVGVEFSETDGWYIEKLAKYTQEVYGRVSE